MKKSKPRKFFIFLLTVISIVLIVWTLWGNTALEVNEITVTGGRIPQVFSGFRIAQVSDLHNAEFGEGNAELLQMLYKTETKDLI